MEKPIYCFGVHKNNKLNDAPTSFLATWKVTTNRKITHTLALPYRFSFYAEFGPCESDVQTVD